MSTADRLPPVDDRPAGVEARAGRAAGPSLIPDLLAIQRLHGWLPRAELEELSRRTRRPLYEIQGLVSFYPHFRTSEPPETSVAVCDDLSCHLAADPGRMAALRDEHGDDAEITRVSCLGRGDQAPVHQVDDAAAPGPARAEPWPNDPYTAHDHDSRYAVLAEVLSGTRNAADVIAAVTDSGLRGMGGAGFPTGRKWEMVAGQPGPVKYAIVNADESEPGTFKDRQILATQPHLVIEGLAIGMRAVGATQGWVFIRHEYGPEERILRAELDRAREARALGDLDIDIFVSPGGYILGEETALIECMEGHRGEPRNKPPFPGSYGLWGKPTLMNSVETFAHVPVIVQRGAEWWQEQGRGEAVGWKFFAVSGDVERPDVYCVPTGTTARELIDMAGGVRSGRPVGAIQPGGASTAFLGPEGLDVPMDFQPLNEAGSALGSGALVVLDDSRDLLAAGTNLLRFFRDESCGKCVPCRVGSHKAHELLEGHGDQAPVSAGTRETISQLDETLRMTSICGLGQVALTPVMSALRVLSDETEGG